MPNVNLDFFLGGDNLVKLFLWFYSDLLELSKLRKYVIIWWTCFSHFFTDSSTHDNIFLFSEKLSRSSLSRKKVCVISTIFKTKFKHFCSGWGMMINSYEKWVIEKERKKTIPEKSVVIDWCWLNYKMFYFSTC